jgi:hypothetical protein
MTARWKATLSILAAALLATATFVAAEQAVAAEPTIDQVYHAAESGNFVQAQQMMDEVLRAHPNSAKAHYVEADLLAKQGRVGSARSELATAERLEPGLPFVRPQAVQELERRVSGASVMSPAVVPPGVETPQRSGLSFSTVLFGLAVVLLAVLIIQAVRRRAQGIPAPMGGTTYGPQGYAPYGPQPQGPVPYGMGPYPSGGMGSGILGGLATGAAVGAGVVAGEALAHRIGQGLSGGAGGGSWTDQGVVESGSTVPDDMGGNDFGIQDTSGWDDGGGGGGGDVGGSDWS